MLKKISLVLTLGLLTLTLCGCSGMAKGVTQALLENAETEDARKCSVKGREFPGLGQYLISRGNYTVDGVERPSTLKILMVHGIGNHQPGYSTRLAENLARKLGLNLIDEKPKRIELRSENAADKDLGILILNRYLDGTSKIGRAHV